MATTSEPKARKRFTAVGWAIWCVYCLVLLEIACRGYWTFQYRVPPLNMREIFAGRYYPELRESQTATAPTTLEDEALDVLILGGSAVTDGYGNIGPTLRDELQQATGRDVRLYNAAAPAMTSRDSLLKYRSLDEQRFDLVVFYHGINDARMNHWPRENFRSDYTHSSWYARIEGLDRHPELNPFIAPYTMEYLTLSLLDKPAFNVYLPRTPIPNGKYFYEGEDVKTGPCFAANLEEILQLAESRGATVLLPTYSIHLPQDEHDYAGGKGGVQGWGSHTGVTAAVNAHNAETRRLASQYDHVHFIDLDKSMPRSGKYFDDVCHLTDLGCKHWVGQAVSGLRPWIAAKSVGSRSVLQAAKPANFK